MESTYELVKFSGPTDRHFDSRETNGPLRWFGRSSSDVAIVKVKKLMKTRRES
jgi:hypothetical protein